MEGRQGCCWGLAGAVFMSVFWLSDAVPIHHLHRAGGGSEDALSLSLFVSLVVSLTLLVALVVLLVNCVTCCKEREINFKEFEDHFDEEIDFTPPAEDTPSIQSPAEVYTLSVSPVILPGPPHLQPPAPITEGSTSFPVARHNLSYIQEIGNGWFGQVLLSEIYTDPGGTRVVVKELKANANSKEQNDFLQQGDPYRVLQHPNILQCLGQCVEAIPYLLVFEYCEMGDLRGYLSQQDWIFRNAEVLQLQRMACEIAAGVTHLHKHNFLHSDLALRNCYLTSDLTVKVGDYGIGPSLYKEDYIITEDDVFAPLRWLAPELVGERHGGVVTLEQSKASNVWALGVTLWELLENTAQPYPHLSDREVLNHVIKEQQVKLFKPQLELPYSDRWYEVLQFCWLSADKRATAEEVHRLLIYLRMQGQKDMEEDFDQRWNTLKPNPSARQTTVSHSSFPILDQFADDAMRQEIDEILTVTETSKGLSFEYVWEAAKQDHYEGNHGRSGVDTTLNYQSMFFPASSEDIRAHFPDPSAGAGDAPSGTSTVLPVFDAQKTSNGNDYFIQLEEPGEGRTGARDQGFTSNQKDFIVLHDVHLDESSTEADFFHQSIDSKDSYLPDSHIWSSLENDSPYHPNIFTEGESKHDDSPSWRRGFVELPERNGCVLQDGAPSDGSSKIPADSFLGVGSEALHRSNSLEKTDTRRGLLNHEKLAENFFFLKEQNLMKDAPQNFLSPRQNFLSPGYFHEPEERFKMKSWDNVEDLGSLNTDTYLKPTGSTSTRKMLLDSSSSDLESYPSPIESGSKVPSITVETEDEGTSPLPESNSPLPEVFHPSSHRAGDSGFDSTSERPDGTSPRNTERPPAFSESAISECTDAKIPSLDEDGVSESLVEIEVCPSNNGLGEDPTCNDLLSELMEDLESTLSDHEESFLDPAGSSLLVSGPSLDQISQDSLLEDSMSNAPPTLADTPDSLDSLYIHRLEEQGEVAPHKPQPPFKVADSGYETENLESPEWNSQPDAEQSPVRNGVAKEEPEEDPSEAGPVPPEIVISEADAVRDGVAEMEAPPPAEEPLMGSNYRDSAYFSDNESEPEKKAEEQASASWSSNAQEVVPAVDGDLLLEERPAEAEAAPSSLTLDGNNLEFIDDDDDDEDEDALEQNQTHVHTKLSRTYASDGLKLKEPDMEGRYLGRRDSQEDGVDADEEDENSEESDDEVGGYQLHSSSSESEDEAVHPVPVVISDDSAAKNLKSLLKPTSLNLASTNHNPESSRRAVSFFDDVTLYLFDQETPTKELSDFSSSSNNRTPELSSPVTSGYMNRFTNSESSTDEEGGGFEWDDDFSSPSPAFASKTSRDPSSKISSSLTDSRFSSSSSSAPVASGLQSSWTSSSSSYSRFSISPASIASFSLTHLTDSDIEQGGSSEDGEKD